MQELLERISANQSLGSFNEAQGLNSNKPGFTAASLRGLGFIRTLILFGIGLLINVSPLIGLDVHTWRIYGVAQRIALCYLAASLLFLHTGPRGQALSLCCLLVGYWALLDLVPVGGRSPGWLDPERNVTALVDRRLLGAGHLYHETWDPEGLLSTIPAIATTLFGVLAGHWLRSAGRCPPRG